MRQASQTAADGQITSGSRRGILLQPLWSPSFHLGYLTDDMRSAFTRPRTRHAGHFALAGKHQRYVNIRPSLYFVEAPSTMNERILAHHLLARRGSSHAPLGILQSLETYYHNYVTTC